MAKRYSPLVTIGIPTYNRAEGFLPLALEAALRQTYNHIEVLISDNCSTDGTPALMERYQDDPRVTYVRQEESLGAVGNFNYCLNAARGTFFLMLHDDDLIDDDFIETCVSALGEVERVGYVRTGNRVINQVGEIIQKYPNRAAGSSGAEAILNWMRFQNFWAFSSTLYETAALRAVGGFSEDEFPLTCDCYATANIALRFGGLEIEPVKASFRVHEGELTNQVSVRRWAEEWYRLYLHLVEMAPTPDLVEQFRKEGGEFFSWLAYRHTENISPSIARYVTVAHVFFKFGGRHLPPSIRSKMRVMREAIVHRAARPLFRYSAQLAGTEE